MNYTSCDFQCPVTGVPVVLVWNDVSGNITAEICDFVWSIWKENNYIESYKYLEDETKKWCDRFCGYANSIEEANDIAEKYDCLFS